jgi:hypothetical protein
MKKQIAAGSSGKAGFGCTGLSRSSIVLGRWQGLNTLSSVLRKFSVPSPLRFSAFFKFLSFS